MKNKTKKYSIVPLSEYRYLTFNVQEEIFNLNFDEILKVIGKCYFNNESLGINKICSLIKDEINKTWHLNKLRRSVRLKKVSTTQIKTVRRSFNRIKNNEVKFIRVPFYVVSILFFILHIFDGLSNNTEILNIKRKLNKGNIGSYIYKAHWEQSQQYIGKNLFLLQDIDDMFLREKYSYIIAQLTDKESMLFKKYEDIEWSKTNLYRIK